MAKNKSLHAITGIGGRVRKRTSRPSPSPAASPRRTQRDQASRNRNGEAYTEGVFDEQLDDSGLVQALVSDVSLTDVVQAMRFARSHMFSPVPTRGLHSMRTSALHARRATCPRLTTRDHLNALLRSPSVVERELAGLVRAGAVRRITVARREETEVLVEGGQLEDVLARAEGVDEAAKKEFADWLRAHPGEGTVLEGGMGTRCADALVREGFLVGKRPMDALRTTGERERLRWRPDAPSSVMALDSVARAASGSLDAVGGTSSSSSGGGGRGGRKPPPPAGVTSESLDLAVPGQGTFLKLAADGVEHLVSLVLNRSRFRQAPEAMLKEWWDAGTGPEAREEEGEEEEGLGRHGDGGGNGWRSGASVARQGSGKRARPWKTSKWRSLDGLSFEWVLAEAVGTGAVEVFDAGPVGRGVRVVECRY